MITQNEFNALLDAERTKNYYQTESLKVAIVRLKQDIALLTADRDELLQILRAWQRPTLAMRIAQLFHRFTKSAAFQTTTQHGAADAHEQQPTERT